MKSEELKARIKNLQERAWDVWTDAHELPRELGLDDRCFFQCGGIKHLACDLTDNLGKLLMILESHCEEEEMTNNEIIAEWLGGEFGGFKIVHGLLHTTCEEFLPDSCIDFWHGEGGLLAKIIQQEKHHIFMRMLVKNTPVNQCPIGIYGGIWFGLRATPAQLATALVATINELREK